MKDLEFDVLINKDNKLVFNYVPSDLAATDDNKNNFHGFRNPKMKPTLSAKIIPSFRKLEKASIYDGLHIIVDSGYRSSFNQIEVFRYFLNKNASIFKNIYPNLSGREIYELAYKKTCERVALPGCSEHQTGYAFDIASIRKGIYYEETNDDERNWMKENAHKYGFILRYPRGKENITGFNYEPWHYRYVGKEISNLLYNGGDYITLEEYHKELKLRR